MVPTSAGVQRQVKHNVSRDRPFPGALTAPPLTHGRAGGVGRHPQLTYQVCRHGVTMLSRSCIPLVKRALEKGLSKGSRYSQAAVLRTGSVILPLGKGLHAKENVVC